MDQIATGVIKRYKDRAAQQAEKDAKVNARIALPLRWLIVYGGVAAQFLSTEATLYPEHWPTAFGISAIRIANDTSLFFAFVAFLALVFFTGDDFGISFDTSIFALPSGYLAECAITMFLLIVSCFQSDFTLIARWGIVLLFFLTTSATSHVLHKMKKLDKEIVEEQEHAAKNPQAPKIKYCEVCAKESLYDLCLDCEGAYRTERQRVRNQILRAKQAHVPATLTLPQWLENLTLYNWRCAYCQTGPYQLMEHYVPITSGGGTTQENCVPGCYQCNSKKSNKHPETQQRPMPVRPASPKRGRK